MTSRMEVAQREAEMARSALMAFVGALDESQLHTSEREGVWCPLEVLEHLRLVEDGTVKLLERRLQRAREQGLGPADANAAADGDAVFLPEIRIHAPDLVRPSGPLAAADVLGGLESSRAALRRLLEVAGQFDVSTVTARHLALGELNFYRWVHFLGAHERRHLAQIQRTLAAAAASPFTNSASTAAANADAYKRSLLALLGDRDPLSVFAELPDAVAELTRGLSDVDARRPERAGKWSVIQVVQHLADSEVVYAYRARVIVAEDTPTILGYDQDRWATRLLYDDESLQDSIADLKVMRERNLRFLRRLSAAELDRSGLHNERGPESVREMARLLAAHDLLHRAQIARIRRTLGV